MGYDTYHQFLLNLISHLVNCFVALSSTAFTDRVPRRINLIVGTFMCAVFLAINGGLSAVWAHYPAGEQNISVGQAAVAAFFMFGVAYAWTYQPLAALYPVECLQTTARAKGMAMSTLTVNAVLFINQFAGPIALKNIRYNYTFVSPVPFPVELALNSNVCLQFTIFFFFH